MDDFKKIRLKDKLVEFLYNIRRSEFFKIFLILLIIILLSVSGIYFIEKGKNEQFKTVFDTVWYTIVTLSTVGYGDKTPATVEGKLIGILMILFGVAIVGAVTGRIASFLVEKQLKAGQGLSSLHKLSNHFIICGYKPELPNIILDILKINPDLKVDKIVLINTMDPQRINDLKADRRFAKIKFLYGDYTDSSVLLRANIKEARTILILADQTSPNVTAHEIDSRTVMAMMTIDALTKKIYSCAELLDVKFENYLKLAHCDEIILSRNYSRIMMANASAATGVSHVVNEIIDVNSPTPIRVINFPENFIGKTYKELSEFYKNKEKSILIGILENTGNIFERKQEVLKEAQKIPDISKLVDNLQQIKKIKPNDPIINPGDNYILKKHSKAIIIPLNKKYIKEKKNGKKA